MQIISLTILVLVIYFTIKWILKKKTIVPGPIPLNYKTILLEEVAFYQQLEPGEQKFFEERALHFLSQIKITGIKTIVEDVDRVLIAASAIIPIFNFPGWEYKNIHEVLLYPDSFDEGFQQVGEGRNVLGMVGNGAMNHVMILSQHELRQDFLNKTGKDNTAIHEFVHLVDKSDGAIDGIPESILAKKYIVPWLQLMQREIALIKDQQSDINPYGATNESEFFAVVSTYFFERPELFQEKHPELFDLMEKIFGPSANNTLSKP